LPSAVSNLPRWPTAMWLGWDDHRTERAVLTLGARLGGSGRGRSRRSHRASDARLSVFRANRPRLRIRVRALPGCRAAWFARALDVKAGWKCPTRAGWKVSHPVGAAPPENAPNCCSW